MHFHPLMHPLPRLDPRHFTRYSRTALWPIPYYDSPVSAGFPSPAEDHFDRSLDLNDLVVKHPAATFFVKVDGESMVDAGIHSGDTLVVDRALVPVGRQVVVAVVDGEFTVKRIEQRQDRLFLVAANPAMEPLEIYPDMNFQVWGVVTYVIHRL